MKRKDLKLIRDKNLSDILKLLKDKKEELALSYAKLKVGKIKDTSVLKKLRKDIAQLLTIAKEKEIAEKVSNTKI